MKNYLFAITTRNGDTETEETYITQFPSNLTKELLDTYQKVMLLNWYYGGYFMDEDSVMFPDGFACYYSQFEEISEEDFNVYNKRTSNMTQKFKTLMEEVDQNISILQKDGYILSEDYDKNFTKSVTVNNIGTFLDELASDNIDEENYEIDTDTETYDEKQMEVYINIKLISFENDEYEKFNKILTKFI